MSTGREWDRDDKIVNFERDRAVRVGTDQPVSEELTHDAGMVNSLIPRVRSSPRPAVIPKLTSSKFAVI